ncbi:isopentenyl-diphosphate Delta-isomerase [Prodigiosinella confusarubida]|uniref:Isopentenyl-diphosphate Delta-isomerase n=1 Tax=Serratia sp. (strain ATCC 39006) TaxID=104623 RepID=A0A2I5TBM5_SERS3|nr:isopentenyl-diphosphate Delta-isomerase [Serratia sp. ATCC 39006]AUH01953.1 isopentenyl-diphosphate Delta-isomerase [Serratia sp. ATCC 39006]AUH06275.1 isopentenyl-diphosphate Delta-isomerase [Serratia sp. ATCC 39006]
MLHRENVVLLDASFNVIGEMAKAEVHSMSTPLHLGFSSYIFNEQRQLLITRRAIDKQTWPGVWTNSVCGHPLPGERPVEAVRRRSGDELNMHVSNVTIIDDNFHYMFRDTSGIVENEYCPVFAAHAASDVHPNPDEVMEHQWIALPDLLTVIKLTPFVFSPWIVKQLNKSSIRDNLLNFLK